MMDTLQFQGAHLGNKLSFFFGKVVREDDSRMKPQAAFLTEWECLCNELSDIPDCCGTFLTRSSVANPKAWNWQTPMVGMPAKDAQQNKGVERVELETVGSNGIVGS
jgi:hypothetical protein